MTKRHRSFRIRQKAVEKNMADRDSLERMDQQALIDMIMLPGFFHRGPGFPNLRTRCWQWMSSSATSKK